MVTMVTQVVSNPIFPPKVHFKKHSVEDLLGGWCALFLAHIYVTDTCAADNRRVEVRSTSIESVCWDPEVHHDEGDGNTCYTWDSDGLPSLRALT